MSLSRESNLYIDEYGIDPLNDRGLTAVSNVTSYTDYTVTAQYAGRPDLIANHFYKGVDLWWAIMAFNGITDVRKLTAGTSIRIPKLSNLMDCLSKATYTENASVGASVTI